MTANDSNDGETKEYAVSIWTENKDIHDFEAESPEQAIEEAEEYARQVLSETPVSIIVDGIKEGNITKPLPDHDGDLHKTVEGR